MVKMVLRLLLKNMYLLEDLSNDNQWRHNIACAYMAFFVNIDESYDLFKYLYNVYKYTVYTLMLSHVENKTKSFCNISAMIIFFLPFYFL